MCPFYFECLLVFCHSNFYFPFCFYTTSNMKIVSDKVMLLFTPLPPPHHHSLDHIHPPSPPSPPLPTTTLKSTPKFLVDKLETFFSFFLSFSLASKFNKKVRPHCLFYLHHTLKYKNWPCSNLELLLLFLHDG